MEIGVIGNHGSHAQPHVAQGRVRGFVPAMHLHLKMVVNPALEIIINMTLVIKSHAQVRMQRKKAYCVKVWFLKYI